MSNLFIIGNGFDLNHKLPTRYTDLYEYLKKSSKGEKFIESLERVISSYSDQLWSDFEASLGLTTSTYILEEALHERSEFNSQFDYETLDESCITEAVIDEKLSSLHRLDVFVEEWIQSVDISNLTPMNAYKNKFMNSDLFITFNYTRVLETIYQIPQDNILHIHGDIENPKMGHGNNNKDHLQEWETNDFVIDEFANSIIRSLKRFYDSSTKNVNQLVHDLEDFLYYKDTNITQVHVIGHSMGEVDLPYFKTIIELFSVDKWVITYYGDKDKIRKEKKIKELIYDANIELIPIDEYMKSPIFL